ncbi:MAG: alkaline phosphatase family protein, partial [Candidatus Micrarchaeota archaeon]
MPKERVLVLGIDAMDPKICEQLIKEGKLRNLSGLNYSRLNTTIPPETPVAWSAASTGTNPGKYGIFDFIGRDVKTYLPTLNLSREKRGIMGIKHECAMAGTPFWR